MYERKIKEEQIEHAIRFYTSSFPTTQSSTELRAMFADGSVLKVWVVGGIPLGQSVIIKSAAWMEL
jgi:hypothetical protein